MSIGDRILAGLKTIVLIEERTKALDDTIKSLKAKVEDKLVEHERRLTRLETMIEIARPDGTVLRIAGRGKVSTEQGQDGLRAARPITSS